MTDFILNIGFSNAILVSKVVGVIAADSAGGRRLKTEAKEKGLLVDATMGRKTRSLIITTSHHVFLSAIQPSSIIKRIEKRDNSLGEEEVEE